MRSRKIRSYILLAVFLLVMMSLPASWTNRGKGIAIALCSPLFALADSPIEKRQIELALLSQENRMLREQILKLQGQLRQEEWVAKQIEWLKEVRMREVTDPYWKEFFERRAQQLAVQLERQVVGIPARVIFRDPGFWNSHVWIDVGQADNRKLGLAVVEKNSVIVIRNQLVGVVEEVSENRSRVRLVTDTQLVPAVRAIRGEQNQRHFLELADQFLDLLRARRGLHGSPQEEQQAIGVIENLRSSSILAWGDHYLAKGELSGSSASLWRSKRQVLKGSGFNYDFADEEGPARDLRSGLILDAPSRKPLSLLQPGDLLITNGMDGIFPAGLEVAVVSSVGLLREGASTYDLEAISVVPDLHDLKEVWVLPPYSR